MKAVTATKEPSEALEVATRVGMASDDVSFAIEFAKRAAVRMFEGNDRDRTFVAALFEEATNYLVSRDLPGLTGTSALLGTAAAARERKLGIRRAVRTTTESIVSAVEVPKNHSTWKKLVSRICEGIRRGAPG
jgi:hypothetical protein